MTQPSNPLIDRRFKGIENWQEWQLLWETSPTTEQLIDLLHCGFNIHGDRLRIAQFYLRVADGHRLTSLFHSVPNSPTKPSALGGENNGFRTERQLCWAVSHKAWAMLCKHLFAIAPYPGKWDFIERSPDAVLDFVGTLLWFYRPFNATIYYGLDNIRSHVPRPGDDVPATKFAIGFAAWSLWVMRADPRRLQTGALLASSVFRHRNARRDLVNLLVRLESTNKLLGGGVPRDRGLLRSLRKEIVTKYSSVQEAAMVASEAAQTYLILREAMRPKSAT